MPPHLHVFPGIGPAYFEGGFALRRSFGETGRIHARAPYPVGRQVETNCGGEMRVCDKALKAAH